MNFVNISWAPVDIMSTLPITSNIPQTFYDVSMTISHGPQKQVVPIQNQLYFIFTPPHNASLCENYNFSLTATPDGATYIGDDCGVHSTTLSVTIPSLPNTTNLESSLKYKLYKKSISWMLNVSFEVSTYLITLLSHIFLCVSGHATSKDFTLYYTRTFLVCSQQFFVTTFLEKITHL